MTGSYGLPPRETKHRKQRHRGERVNMACFRNCDEGCELLSQVSS